MEVVISVCVMLWEGYGVLMFSNFGIKEIVVMFDDKVVMLFVCIGEECL